MAQQSTTTSAVSSATLDIPLIDFSAFLDGNRADRLSTSKAILDGFRRAGFIYLRNHGIVDVEKTFKHSATFFAKPKAEKDALAWLRTGQIRGYNAQGEEKLNNVTDPSQVIDAREYGGEDIKETLEIGREGVPGEPNKWPAGDDDFKECMVGFFSQCRGLHVELMRAIAIGFGIAENWFDDFVDAGDNVLRLLHYPEVNSNVFRSNGMQVRAGAHCDYGSITLLFQDDRGGLQVLSPNGEYVHATPIKDTIVVNSGDLLARWSNDMIKSTKHRVVEPPRRSGDDVDMIHPDRYSIAYFCVPNLDKYVDVIPGTLNASSQRKYEGVICGDYMAQKFTATFGVH
ncbi:Clavaminate synthase-like protein [Myriangium duriaei CBS 260.36]|uniref:Clavaminate synthase-like protein n=1 Tax=Myriangium duriaei CBS 260.36 TaxID=1168546 RepID=A0A9P4J7C3_9PEZI|nr:Clavaminate synthase-like protein [Myriangium duriaei CBS 260.36]